MSLKIRGFAFFWIPIGVDKGAVDSSVQHVCHLDFLPSVAKVGETRALSARS